MSIPLWPSTSDEFCRPLETSLDAGTVIVGTGISGLTTAYELALNGHKPVLIDAGNPGMGETHHTTAHLSSVIDDRFVQIEKWHGPEGSKLAYQSHAAAIDWIERTVHSLDIPCEFARVNGYLFSTERIDREFLLEELEASRRAGHSDAQWLPHTPLPGLDKHICLRFPNQARVNPGLYLNGLLRELHRLGISIYKNTRVLSWEEQKERILLKTGKKMDITCDRVVFACHDPYVRFRYYTLHAPYRSYALAFAVPDEIENDGLFWDLEDPYHYIRFASAPDGKGRVMIVGGEDHKTGQKEHSEECWTKLEAWARRHLPFTGNVVTQWSGQILETLDGLAFIGKDPGGHDKVFLVSGDSGMGITHGTLGGILLSRLILDGKHPWEKLYDPGRFRWKALNEFVRENANVARQYTHHAFPATEKKEDARDGHGAIIQEGLKKVACISKNGVRKELTAVCPHMGGLVTWNEAEGTWDCECHGSRFTESGEVLNGPAVTPLEIVHGEDTRQPA